MKVIQNALLYNKMSVTIKEYKEVPLSLRGRTHSLKPHLIPGAQLEPIAPWR